VSGVISTAPRPTHLDHCSGESLAMCRSLIGLGFELHISCTRSRYLTTYVLRVETFLQNECMLKNSRYLFVGSVAEKVKAPFLQQPCDHDHMIYVQLPPSSDTLLHPWIRCFTMIISAWWLRTSSKFSAKKSKKQPKNSEMDNSKAGVDSSKI